MTRRATPLRGWVAGNPDESAWQRWVRQYREGKAFRALLARSGGGSYSGSPGQVRMLQAIAERQVRERR